MACAPDPRSAPSGPDAEVVVTVGSDHHRFDRLVRWVDEWAVRHPEVSVWIQYGTSAPPVHAAGVAFAPHGELLHRVEGSVAVVTSAGPGAVMEVRAAGLRPIVVPRRGALEEAVDDHQRAFAHRLHQEGMAVACERAEELWVELDGVLDDPTRARVAPVASGEPPARARIGALVDDLIARRRA